MLYYRYSKEIKGVVNMIRSIKKEQKRTKTERKKTVLQKMYDKQKLFYRLIVWFGKLEDIRYKRVENRNRFKSIMYWSFVSSPYCVLKTERRFETNDSFVDDIANSTVLEMILNPKYQKKISYSVENLTGIEYIEWIKKTYLNPVKEVEYEYRVRDLQNSPEIKDNLNDKVFYIIRHQ